MVRSALESISVEARSRILASLARRFSDLDLAEEMLQEAMVQALRTWGRDGVPVVPEAWLTTVAARRGMDMLRQDQARARMIPRLGVLQERDPAAATELDPAQVLDDEPAFTDERLGLFFACAHPLLKPEEQVALTLRFLAGLSTAEVAHGLLVPVATMQQRIVRAKRRIRSLGISFEIPTRQMLPERLGAVQRVVVRLGRAVAIGRARGLDEGLRQLEVLAADPALQRFRAYHVAGAVTLQELGDDDAAASAYERALELAGNAAENELLVEALATVRPSR